MGETGGNWRDNAACLKKDPELFFPVGEPNEGSPALAQANAAKEICNGCEVQETCLQYALETGQDSGVWGGMTEQERRDMKRRNNMRRRIARRSISSQGV